MNNRLALGIGLFLAATSSAWWAWNNREPPQTQLIQATDTDYRLEDFEIVVLDKQGHESATLRAPFLERKRDSQLSHITQPLFLLPNSHSAHWQLRADNGQLSAKGEELYLHGNVVAHSPPDHQTPPTALRTSTLTVLTQTHLASTDQFVTLTRANLHQTGIGFEANLKSRNYTLHSQVKTRYGPISD